MTLQAPIRLVARRNKQTDKQTTVVELLLMTKGVTTRMFMRIGVAHDIRTSLASWRAAPVSAGAGNYAQAYQRVVANRPKFVSHCFCTKNQIKPPDLARKGRLPLITVAEFGIDGHYMENMKNAYCSATPSASLCILVVRPIVTRLGTWTVHAY